MTQTIDQIYFTWLTDRIDFNFGRSNGKAYVDLMCILHSTEFVWVVPNDDNRVEDAAALRQQFLDETGITAPPRDFLQDRPFSVLEVLLGLSSRCAFNGGGTPPNWAWRLIENLDLHNMSDPVTTRKHEKITDILETLIYRTYEPDGSGGFFPLTHPRDDQRKVEIWYQMNAYLDELES
jgi:hypothetical protein